MYSDRIYLTPQELLEYEFKIDARGYRPQEVDKVLDMVIRDETEYISTIKQQEKQIKDLTDDNIKLKQELRRTKMDMEEMGKIEHLSAPNNVDLLKRISQLEKIVYEKID